MGVSNRNIDLNYFSDSICSFRNIVLFGFYCDLSVMSYWLFAMSEGREKKFICETLTKSRYKMSWQTSSIIVLAFAYCLFDCNLVYSFLESLLNYYQIQTLYALNDRKMDNNICVRRLSTHRNQPKPTETNWNPPKPTETNRKPPKPTETNRNPPKPTEAHGNPRKPTETHRSQPKLTHRNPPKPKETNRNPPKPTETQELNVASVVP